MKRINLFLIADNILFFAILFNAAVLFAQDPLNLSGKWAFDQDKSKAAEGTSFSGSEVTLDIVHDQYSVKITKIINTPGGLYVDTTFDEYVLDGKEKIIKEASLVTKRTGSWSADKKQIILIKTVTLTSNVYTTEDVYSLADNKNILTVNSSETMNSKKGKILLVYNKK